jgi:hypothetical protein
MAPESGLRIADSKQAERWFLIVWLIVSVWIFACAIMVQGEYGDGYQTIVNARFLFADSPGFYVQRGPLAAIALWPVETLRTWFDWNAVDVRPYHVYSGILHSLYLIGCWYLLKRTGPNRVAQIIAFVAAILSVVFYANAPHLSHDIIPGLLFLLLIFICNRWLNAPSRILGLQLVLLGTAVTFIKQTYALFWAALVFYALVALAMKWDDGRVTVRKSVILVGLAGFSGVLSWIGYGVFAANELTAAAILAAPLELLGRISDQYGDQHSSIFSPELYLRNLHNYGIAVVLMVIPGLVYAFRSTDARLRMIAFCWVVCVVAMQLVSFKEVRYLAFLAPLSAVLIVPVVQSLITHRLAAGLLMALILFDQYRGISVSAAQLSSTAGVDIRRFLEAPEGDGRVFSSRILSFVYMPDSPMLRDPYHGIYHLTPPLIYWLHEGQVEVHTIENPRELGTLGLEVGDRVYFASDYTLRRAPWRDDNVPAVLATQIMVAGNVTKVELVRAGDRYVVANGDDRYFLYIPGTEGGDQVTIVSRSGLDVATARAFFGESADRDSFTVMAIAVKALCQAEQCVYR